MNPLASEFFAAMQDLLLDGDPHPRASEPAAPAPTVAPMIWCTACGGSGESHSAYRDSCCGGCDGVGKRPSNWRELV